MNMKYIIEVERRRSSVTQGSAHVFVNGVEVADFNDEIKLLKKGEHYYGSYIDGWASVTPDESFIKGMLFHPFEELYHMSEKFRKILDDAIEEAKVETRKKKSTTKKPKSRAGLS